MSLQKTKIRSEIIRSYGEQTDDFLEGAYKQQAGHGAAKTALKQLSETIWGLSKMVDKELDGGTLPTEPIAVATYTKLMIDRAANMALNGSRHRATCEIASGGEIAAFEKVIALLKKNLNAEIAKVEQLQNMILSESEGPREPGTRPAPSIATQRKAEELHLVEIVKAPTQKRPVSKRSRKRTKKLSAGNASKRRSNVTDA